MLQAKFGTLWEFLAMQSMVGFNLFEAVARKSFPKVVNESSSSLKEEYEIAGEGHSCTCKEGGGVTSWVCLGQSAGADVVDG